MRLQELENREVLALRAGGRADGTIYLARLALRRLAGRVGASFDVADVDVECAGLYAGDLWESLCGRSVRRELGCLRAAWRRAHVTPCPWSELPPIRVDPVPLRIVTADEERLLRSAAGERLSLWLAVALETGARPGEIAALRSADVLRDRAAILIQSRANQRTKTRGSSRMNAVSAETHKKLVHIASLVENVWCADPRLVGPRVRQALYRLCELVGVPRVMLQDLRRTVATRMAMAGISPAIAARVLGHASPVTTMMYYTRVLEADAAAAVARTWVL